MRFTSKEAFQVMYLFLEKQYNKIHSDDLGWLMGGLCWNGFAGEKPDFWDYWEISVKKTFSSTKNEGPKLTCSQTFQATYYFLDKIFNSNNTDNHTKQLLSALNFEKDKPTDPELKKDWDESVEKISKGLVDESHFKFRIID